MIVPSMITNIINNNSMRMMMITWTCIMVVHTNVTTDIMNLNNTMNLNSNYTMLFIGKKMMWPLCPCHPTNHTPVAVTIAASIPLINNNNIQEQQQINDYHLNILILVPSNNNNRKISMIFTLVSCSSCASNNSSC